jgi:hypothetical protein
MAKLLKESVDSRLMKEIFQGRLKRMSQALESVMTSNLSSPRCEKARVKLSLSASGVRSSLYEDKAPPAPSFSRLFSTCGQLGSQQRRVSQSDCD